MYISKKIKIGWILLSIIFALPFINAQDTTNTKQENSIPEGLTALDVINRYVEATGGTENYLDVKDRTTIIKGKMMSREFSVTIQQKAPDKLRQEIQAGPATQTFIFDGTKAVMIMGDNITPISGNELDQTKIEAQMNFLLDPEAYRVTPELIGTEMIDSVQCYKISMTSDTSTTWLQYYDVDSGLKVKEIRDVATTQGKLKQESVYSDYKEANGILYPFKIKQTMGMQTAEMNVVSIEVNTGFEDKVFEIEE